MPLQQGRAMRRIPLVTVQRLPPELPCSHRYRFPLSSNLAAQAGVLQPPSSS
jgi:hypothetical protein